MSLFYSLAYRLGFTPWEHAATHPPAVQHIMRLFEREERGRQPPYGRALDLGCGAGHWVVTLARRGWQVTGVELVPKAVRAARARVENAGVDAEIAEGDVAALQNAGVGDGFRLIWDFGTVHGLSHAQPDSVAREVDAIATDDATMLLLAWALARRGPVPGGMSRREIDRLFRGEERGDLTLKLPGAYGRGIRSPRTAVRETIPEGRHIRLLGGDLETEAQAGLGVGSDLFLGEALSLQLTRLEQLAPGPIQTVAFAATPGRPAPGVRRRISCALPNVGRSPTRDGKLRAGRCSGARRWKGAMPGWTAASTPWRQRSRPRSAGARP